MVSSSTLDLIGTLSGSKIPIVLPKKQIKENELLRKISFDKICNFVIRFISKTKDCKIEEFIQMSIL